MEGVRFKTWLPYFMKTTGLKIIRACALVFMTAAAHALQPEVLYAFQADGPSKFTNANGAFSEAGLVLGRDGHFYGTTSQGGSHGYGTVFKVTASGVLAPLVSLPFPPGGDGEGASPSPAGLVLGNDGSFYGTTAGQPFFLGRFSGSVFRVATDGALTILAPNAWLNPRDRLALGHDGAFNGTTWNEFFKITTNGELTTFALFDASNGGLVLGKDGAFYGTTEVGGVDSFGTIFRVTPDGVSTRVASFDGDNGAYPLTGLVSGNDGDLYRTTGGTVYKVTTNGVLTKLATFNGANGANCQARLLLGPDGNFYGTTSYGGTGGCNDGNGSGCGTLFRMTPNGALTTLGSFNGTNGAHPRTELIFGNDGSLYGTTSSGGPAGGGTIFRLAMPSSIHMARQPSGSALLTGAGPRNGSYRLWTSGDLSLPFASWTLLTSASFDSNGNFSYTDASAATNTFRFYQLSVP